MRGGLAFARKRDSWYMIAIMTGMGLPHSSLASAASSYQSSFSSKMAQMSLTLLGGEVVQAVSASRHDSATRTLLKR